MIGNSSTDEYHSMLPLRHSPNSSSWLCCKFWKRTSNSSTTEAETSSQRSMSSTSTANSNSPSRRRNTNNQRCQKYSGILEELARRFIGNHSNRNHAADSEDAKRTVERINRFLERLPDEPDIPAFGEEECLICTTNRASMQTFPCGHKVLCKPCFLTTLQVELQEGQPLRCVICRSGIVHLKKQSPSCPVVVRQQREPPGSFYVPQTLSPLPPSGIRYPGYM